MRTAAGPAALLAAALRGDPTRPAVTYYDDATGERVELSYATLDNWVAKTANLVQEDLGLAPGARVAVDLPPHWTAPVWLLAAWSAGLVVDLRPGTAADLAVTTRDAAGRWRDRSVELVVLALQPLGRPAADPAPAGTLDYDREIPSYGDRFVPSVPVGAEQPALMSEQRSWSQGDLGDVDPLGLSALDRVLSTAPYDAWATVHAGLLAPLRARAGVVLVRNPDAHRLGEHVAQERVTGAVDPGASGIRRLPER